MGKARSIFEQGPPATALAPARVDGAGPEAARAGGLELLGSTAGNAAVSRLLSAGRPPPPAAPPPPASAGQRTPSGGPGAASPGQAAFRHRRFTLALPPSSGPSIGIVPSPAIQRVPATAVIDVEHASAEDAGPVATMEKPATARAIEAAGLRTTRREEGSGLETMPASASTMEGQSDAPDERQGLGAGSAELVVSRAAAATAESVGVESDTPTAVDVDVASARGPPEAAPNTPGPEAPAATGGATEPVRPAPLSKEAAAPPATDAASPSGPPGAVWVDAPAGHLQPQIFEADVPDGGDFAVEQERGRPSDSDAMTSVPWTAGSSSSQPGHVASGSSLQADAVASEPPAGAVTPLQRRSARSQQAVDGRSSRSESVPGHHRGCTRIQRIERRTGSGVPDQLASARRGGTGIDGLALARAAGFAAESGAQPLSLQRKAGSYAPPAPPVPPNPKRDPRFTKVSGELKKTSKQTKAHPPGKVEAKKAADAAMPPANDKQAQAKAGQADKMAGAKKGGFDKAAFIAAVKQAIAAAAPKTLEDADKFADSGKAAGVKDQVMSKVAKGKDDSAKDVTEKTKEAPDPSKAKDKPVKPLEEDKEAKPKAPDCSKAMPTKVPPEQTDLDGPKNEVKDKMAEADVSEKDLEKSNEPQMMAAVEAKKEGDAQSAKAPKEIRAKEAEVLKKAEAGADQKGKSSVEAMAGSKKNALTQAGAKKADQKSKDEAKRAEIAGELNKIFDKTKGDVEKILTDLDPKVDEAFTKGESDVRKAFTAEHKRELEAFKSRRYAGFDGKIQWGIDLFKDLSEVREVKQIYERAKANYEKGMERVISNVADVVGREIDKAKDRITSGRLEIKDWVAKQPKDIQKLAADAAKGMDDKFNQLESDVDAKSESLASDLAGKYTAALGEVNKEIEDAQAENKSLWSKAKAAVGDAIEAILKLKDLFMGMLAKAAGAFKKIIADPLKFIGNFLSAVKAGFLGFAERIGEHLKKGLQGWLFGKLADAGIEIPDKLDLQGIIRMVLSILGLTWGAIRPKIVKVVGEKAMAFLETKAEVFMVLVKEGVGGLWRWIVDKVGDLKEMVMGQIRDFVITKIVKAGITWVIGMLNPAGALIKIIQTLISVIQWIMEKGAALVELVGTVIDSVSDIANGGMGGVPAKIEGALGKAVPIVISFLASLLGLGGIGEKIKSILDTVRQPVSKAVDSVIGGALKLAKGLLSKLGLAKKEAPTDPKDRKKQTDEGLRALDGLSDKHAAGVDKKGLERDVRKVKKLHPVFESIAVEPDGPRWSYSYVVSRSTQPGPPAGGAGGAPTTLAELQTALTGKALEAFGQQQQLTSTSRFRAMEGAFRNPDNTYDVAKATAFFDGKWMDPAAFAVELGKRDAQSQILADEQVARITAICRQTTSAGRPGASIGDGSSEAALQHEAKIGEPVFSAAGHYLKVPENKSGLEDAIRRLEELKPKILDAAKVAAIDAKIGEARARIAGLATGISAWSARVATYPSVWNPDGTSKVKPGWPK